MTLIVGIKCSDGVVVGADGAATLGPAVGPGTVMQPTSKLHYLDGPIIMGVAGQVGLGQLFSESIPRVLQGKLIPQRGPRTAEIQRQIQKAIAADVSSVMAAAKASETLVGVENAEQQFLTDSIIALPVQGQPALMHASYVGLTEAATDELPFIAVGAGQRLAEPFLAFIRHIYWTERIPTVVDGIFAAVWALLNAIQLNPGLGLSEPVEVGILRLNAAGVPVATPLSADDLGQYRQLVAEAEGYMAEFREHLPTSIEGPPEPPPQGRLTIP